MPQSRQSILLFAAVLVFHGLECAPGESYEEVQPSKDPSRESLPDRLDCLAQWKFRASGVGPDEPSPSSRRSSWWQSLDDQLTTDNVKKPRSDQAWNRYKRKFGKSYKPDEEAINRTLFVRRLEYLIDRVDYCREGAVVLDEWTDTLKMPMTAEDKVGILKLWSKYHNWNELIFYKQWKFGLFAIYYFHRGIMKKCANYELAYHLTLEELLYK